MIISYLKQSLFTYQQSILHHESSSNQMSHESNEDNHNHRTTNLRFRINISRLLAVFLSILSIVFVATENLISLVIITCDDVVVPIEQSENQFIFQSNHSSKLFLLSNDLLKCELLRHHFNRISPVLIILIISIFTNLGFIINTILIAIYFIVYAIIFSTKSSQTSSWTTSSWTTSSWTKSLWSSSFPISSSQLTILFSDEYFQENLLFLIILILIINQRNRQIERSLRCNFLWKQKLRVEQDDVETIGGINKILLENILPQHVAQHFLLMSTGQTDKLYHERYA